MTAPTVKVKSLEWRQVDDDDFEAVEYDCHAVSNGKGWGLAPRGWPCLGDHPYRTLEAAKAAAQADYDARILSAIDTTDFEAHIGAALAEAAGEVHIQTDLIRKGCGGVQHRLDICCDRIDAILALRPTALTALDRAKREARVEGMEQALALADEWTYACDAADAIRALIEKEGKP